MVSTISVSREDRTSESGEDETDTSGQWRRLSVTQVGLQLTYKGMCVRYCRENPRLDVCGHFMRHLMI